MAATDLMICIPQKWATFAELSILYIPSAPVFEPSILPARSHSSRSGNFSEIVVMALA
jgi:hypothetical protein